MIIIRGQCLDDNQYVKGDRTLVYFSLKLKWTINKDTVNLNEFIYMRDNWMDNVGLIKEQLLTD